MLTCNVMATIFGDWLIVEIIDNRKNIKDIPLYVQVVNKDNVYLSS